MLETLMKSFAVVYSLLFPPCGGTVITDVCFSEIWAASVFENLFSGRLSLVSNVFNNDVDDNDGDYDDGPDD